MALARVVVCRDSCDLHRRHAESCRATVWIVSAARDRTPVSIAFAVLLSVTALAGTARATGQDERSAPTAGPRHRPFVTVLMAVPLVTYAGAAGPRASEILTPADRFATSQLVGIGHVVNPRFRVGVMGIFNEALTGVPPGADAWQFGGIAPVAIGTFNRFIIGGGPIIGYRSGGKTQTDVGAVVVSGASIPLRRGFALNVVAPVTALLARRVTVSVGAAVGVSKVFWHPVGPPARTRGRRPNS
jgi:hypothetical protein